MARRHFPADLVGTLRNLGDRTNALERRRGSVGGDTDAATSLTAVVYWERTIPSGVTPIFVGNGLFSMGNCRVTMAATFALQDGEEGETLTSTFVGFETPPPAFYGGGFPITDESGTVTSFVSEALVRSTRHTRTRVGISATSSAGSPILASGAVFFDQLAALG